MQAYSKDGGVYESFAQFEIELKQVGRYNLTFNTIMYCNDEDKEECARPDDTIVVGVLFDDNKNGKSSKISKGDWRNEVVATINIKTFEENKWAQSWHLLEIEDVAVKQLKVNFFFIFSEIRFFFHLISPIFSIYVEKVIVFMTRPSPDAERIVYMGFDNLVLTRIENPSEFLV